MEFYCCFPVMIYFRSFLFVRHWCALLNDFNLKQSHHLLNPIPPRPFFLLLYTYSIFLLVYFFRKQWWKIPWNVQGSQIWTWRASFKMHTFTQFSRKEMIVRVMQLQKTRIRDLTSSQRSANLEGIHHYPANIVVVHRHPFCLKPFRSIDSLHGGWGSVALYITTGRNRYRLHSFRFFFWLLCPFSFSWDKIR